MEGNCDDVSQVNIVIIIRGAKNANCCQSTSEIDRTDDVHFFTRIPYKYRQSGALFC